MTIDMQDGKIKSEALLDVRFGGAFSTDEAYTNATGEIKDGNLLRRTKAIQINEHGVVLDGKEDGVVFQARHSFGRTELTESFVIEVEYKLTAEPMPKDTILAIAGHMYVRYQSPTIIEYGFAVRQDGEEKIYHQQVAAPTTKEKVSLALVYEPTQNGATMGLVLNDVEQPILQSEHGKAKTLEENTIICFGNEVHNEGLDRGINGSFSRVILTAFSGSFHDSLLKLTNKESVANITDSPSVDPADLKPGYRIPIAPNESPEILAEKASLVRPLPRQVTWQKYEQTAFIHYGINTYYGVEWGNFNEDPNMFQPTELDTDQWARTLKESGFKLAILTAKHHDGFTLYPTRYTDFSVASSSWRDGKGDVVREFVNSMRKYGIKVGIYLSPSDHQAYVDGILANDSPRSERVIPTLVENDDRAGDPNLRTFTLQATDYGEMLLNQLYEVLTEYGEVDEVWFDGAQGNLPGNKVEHYDWDSYYTLINALAPNAVVAVSGHDVRWVGNESGRARENEWSIIASTTEASGKQEYFPEFNSPDVGSRKALRLGAAKGMDYLTWWPAEVDVSIRTGWFYHDNQQPKSIEELRDIYYQSVGRNSVLLLNIPPDKRGKFADVDVKRLKDWYQTIEDDFSIDHAKQASIKAENGEVNADPTVLVDDIYNNTWKSKDTSPCTFTFSFKENVTVDKVILQEDIQEGQQIESIVVDVLGSDGEWKEVIVGGSIGYKRIFLFEGPVVGKVFRVRILQTRGQIHLSKIGLYEGK